MRQAERVASLGRCQVRGVPGAAIEHIGGPHSGAAALSTHVHVRGVRSGRRPQWHEQLPGVQGTSCCIHDSIRLMYSCLKLCVFA